MNKVVHSKDTPELVATIRFIEAVDKEELGPVDRGAVSHARMEAFAEAFACDELILEDVSLTASPPIINLFIS